VSLLIENLGEVDIHHGNEDSSNLTDVEAMQNFKDASNGSVGGVKRSKNGGNSSGRTLTVS
jgi:hypothetical protein